MSRVPITLRLKEDIALKLIKLAGQQHMVRQEFLELHVTELVSGIELEPDETEESMELNYVPENILSDLADTIRSLPLNTEFSLKSMVGAITWSQLSHSTRRAFGKSFFRQVKEKKYPGLKAGRKLSSNEQQYEKYQ